MSSSHRGDRHKKIKYKNSVKRPAKRPWAILSGAAVVFKALIVAVPMALILESIGIVDLTRVHTYTNPYTDPYISPLKARWAEFWSHDEIMEEAVAVAEPELIPEKLPEEVTEAATEIPVVEFVSAEQEEIVLASEPAEPIIDSEVEQVQVGSTDTGISSITDDSAIVTTYRATFFSDPSSIGAAERPITRGTRVQILERQADWVKVQSIEGCV